MAVLPLYLIVIPYRRSFAAAIGGNSLKRRIVKTGARTLHWEFPRATRPEIFMLMLMLEHSCFDYDYEQEDDLQQFQPRQILRINNADRRVVVVNDDEIIDTMAFQKIENFDGQFVLVHAYRIQRH